MKKKTKPNKVFIAHTDILETPTNFERIGISDLDKTKDGSLKEIFITSVLGGFSDENVTEFIRRCVNKLDTDGIMYIQDLDIEQICVYLSHKVLAIAEKNLLYKNRRTNIFYMRYIIDILGQFKNITIEQVNFINGYEFFIQIKKNG